MKKILLYCILFINISVFSEAYVYTVKPLSDPEGFLGEEIFNIVSNKIINVFENLPEKSFVQYSDDMDSAGLIAIEPVIEFFEKKEKDGKIFIRLDVGINFIKEIDEDRELSGFKIAAGGFNAVEKTGWLEVLEDIEKNVLFNINKFPENKTEIRVQGFFAGEVLINAGTADGLKRDDEFEVYLKDGDPGAIIRVEHIYENTSLCSIIRNTGTIKKGDKVKFRKQGLFYNNYFVHINKKVETYQYSTGINFIYRKSKINIYPYVGFEIFSPYENIYEKKFWENSDDLFSDLKEKAIINSYIGWHIARHVKNFYIAGNVSLFLTANLAGEDDDSKFSHWGSQTGAFIGYSFSPYLVLGIEGGREYYLSRNLDLYNDTYFNYLGLSLIVRK